MCGHTLKPALNRLGYAYIVLYNSLVTSHSTYTIFVRQRQMCLWAEQEGHAGNVSLKFSSHLKGEHCPACYLHPQSKPRADALNVTAIRSCFVYPSRAWFLYASRYIHPEKKKKSLCLNRCSVSMHFRVSFQVHFFNCQPLAVEGKVV